MKFDPDAIRQQISHLTAERDRIDQAIQALEMALRSLDEAAARQGEFSEGFNASGVTLHDAVKKACSRLVDGITRQRVIVAIEGEHALLKPKPSSVAASLINLTKGEHPLLHVALEGRGRTPAYYSTEEETVHELSSEESRELMVPLRGTGGYQSLLASLQSNFDKATGIITLTPRLRARIFKDYHYSSGGFQERLKKIFRRNLPHLFIPENATRG